MSEVTTITTFRTKKPMWGQQKYPISNEVKQILDEGLLQFAVRVETTRNGMFMLHQTDEQAVALAKHLVKNGTGSREVHNPEFEVLKKNYRYLRVYGDMYENHFKEMSPRSQDIRMKS